LEIRKHYPALHRGNFSFINWKKSPKSLLAYKRTIKETNFSSCIEIFLNLGNSKLNLNLQTVSRKCIFSTNINSDPIKKSQILLLPYEGIITELKV
jgi:hypothetical protein